MDDSAANRIVLLAEFRENGEIQRLILIVHSEWGLRWGFGV
jgi:hypothetical protein